MSDNWRTKTLIPLHQTSLGFHSKNKEADVMIFRVVKGQTFRTHYGKSYGLSYSGPWRDQSPRKKRGWRPHVCDIAL